MKAKIVKQKWKSVTIGYFFCIDGRIIYTVQQSDNGSWNIFKGEDLLKGWLESFDTLKECKEYIDENIEEAV